MTCITGSELIRTATLGARVTFNDDTPEPPARFKRKLADWRRHNGEGVLVGINPGSEKEYDGPRFTLRTKSSDFLKVNVIFSAASAKRLTVTPPAPGTIIAYSAYGDLTRKTASCERAEAANVWPEGEQEARAWAVRNRYDLGKCGYKFWRVDDAGVLDDWVPVDDAK